MVATMPPPAAVAVPASALAGQSCELTLRSPELVEGRSLCPSRLGPSGEVADGAAAARWARLAVVLVSAVNLSVAGCSRRQSTYAGDDANGGPPQVDEAAREARARFVAQSRTSPRYNVRITPPLPNPICGPDRPQPPYCNFYEIYPDDPEFLLCVYYVNEADYDSNNEPAWLSASLAATRQFGRHRFPSAVRYVAVIVTNMHDHHDEESFESSHKVGAAFDARAVFDASVIPQTLVAHADLDRHPFAYDPRGADGYDQQIWLVAKKYPRRAKDDPPATRPAG